MEIAGGQLPRMGSRGWCVCRGPRSDCRACCIPLGRWFGAVIARVGRHRPIIHFHLLSAASIASDSFRLCCPRTGFANAWRCIYATPILVPHVVQVFLAARLMSLLAGRGAPALRASRDRRRLRTSPREPSAACMTWRRRFATAPVRRHLIAGPPDIQSRGRNWS